MQPRELAPSAAKWLAARRWFRRGVLRGVRRRDVVAVWEDEAMGRPGDKADALLDMFMPNYEVMDRHRKYVRAPAEVALSAASEMDLESCAVVRGIFKGRELILRSKPDNRIRPIGLLAEMKSLGWGTLAKVPGREIVMGGVTKPWEAKPVFHSLPPDEFGVFQEPGYVKIVWTLRADPIGNNVEPVMVLLKAFTVWLVLLLVESAHGIFRRLVLEPWTGDFSARQISVFTGSVLILIVAYLFVDWIGAETTRQLTLVGVVWVMLTLAFEIGVGRFLLEYSWERVLSDFNLARGGLLGIGLLIMGLAPRISANLRRVRASRA